MKTSKRFYIIGMILAFLIMIFAQIIWLFDPLRLHSQMYWMDTLEIIIYGCLLVPLLWWIAAGIGIRALYLEYQQMHRPAMILWIILKIVILMVTSLTMVVMIVDMKKLSWIATGLIVSWLCVMIDLLIIGRHMARRWNRQSVAVVFAFIVMAVILLLPTPYMVTYPGLTINMNQYAEVEGGQRVGDISGVLVFERPAFPIDWLYALWFPHYEFTKRLKSDPPIHEQLSHSKRLQLHADLVAIVVAFEKAGYQDIITPEGEVRLPKEVEFQSHLLHAGGPSHGAMLTLSILNQLTPEGVIYGNRVAGTGTINLEGEIGNIGGIKQKAFIVERAGADVFFVPVEQAEEARKGARHLQIVPVRHFDEILHWLKNHPKTPK